jgi:hypothetical protein
VEAKAGRLSKGDEAWFRGLISSFESEFRKWPTSTGDIHKYLQLFEGNEIDPHLRLAAHAFLHIAYDLPRVIATSLRTISYSRSSMRTAFLRPGPVFLRAFLDHATGGGFGILGRIAGRFEPMRALAYWVIALRSVAWVHAEILSESAPGALDARMAQELCRAGIEATRRKWILGVPELDNSRMFQAVPLLLSLPAN